MTRLDPEDVTRLLKEVEQQTPGAVDQLVGLVYTDLRRIASGKLRRDSGPESLQPTAMVHEVFLRLFGTQTPSWPDRRCFFLAASRAVRDILVDRARRAMAKKRGGGWKRLPLDDEALLVEESENIVQLTEALTALGAAHPRPLEVVELKYFAGLTEAKIAMTLGISEATVRRDWQYARAWLAQRMSASQGERGTRPGTRR